MKQKNKKPEQRQFTPDQQKEIAAIHLHIAGVRGMQLFIIGLGAYLAHYGGRGWPSFIIGVCLAIWMQFQMPVLPEWLEKHRPKT
jgi:hypothetical protein